MTNANTRHVPGRALELPATCSDFERNLARWNGCFHPLGDLPQLLASRRCRSSTPHAPLVVAIAVLFLLTLLVSTIGGCKSAKRPRGERERTAATSKATTMEAFFADDAVHRLRLELPAEAIESLRQKPRSYVEGTFHVGDAAYPVSVKLKGHRSFREIDNKPAIKMRFNRSDSAATFLGLKGLTLNNMVDDPTRMREMIGYRLYRAAGLAAPRTAYSYLKINDLDLGLYLAVEPIDDAFVAGHFGEPIGGLYEAEYGCDLYPPDIALLDLDYGPESSRERLLVLAKAAAAGDESLLTGESALLDSAAVITYLAMATMLGDFDGYWHSHNYFFYEEKPEGPWLILPWGIDRIFNDRVDIFGSHGRLAELCFASAACRVDYSKRLLELASLVDSLDLEKEMRRLFALLGSSANFDPRDGIKLEERHDKKRRMREYIKERPEEVREALTCIVDGEEVDLDGDGYGCGDCDDGDPSIHLGATELCDDIDNDCNGLVDDAPACGCKVVEVDGVSFHLCEWWLSWTEARDFCAAQNLQLAKLDSKEQSEKLFAAAREIEDNRWWIGASDRGEEGRWAWLDGKAAELESWASEQPDDAVCGQDCASLDNEAGAGLWTDDHCEQNYPFVCR